MAKKEIVVLGVGRFATELINKLNKTNDFNIVAIDIKQEKLEKLKDIKNVIMGDATKKEFLLNVGIENADYYIIGMGQDFQSSLIITSMIKDNFKGKIIAKSIDEGHERILQSLGVDEIITPEVAAAGIIYRKIINPLTQIEGGEMYQMNEVAKGVSIVNVPVLKKYLNTKIKDIDFNEGIGVALITKKETGPEIVSGETIIEEGDIVALIGRDQQLLKTIENIHVDKIDEELIEEESVEEVAKEA